MMAATVLGPVRVEPQYHKSAEWNGAPIAASCGTYLEAFTVNGVRYESASAGWKPGNMARGGCYSTGLYCRREGGGAATSKALAAVRAAFDVALAALTEADWRAAWVSYHASELQEAERKLREAQEARDAAEIAAGQAACSFQGVPFREPAFDKTFDTD
jgi:hypothetical protein